MRKPISKHALRRALERVQGEGLVTWSDPTGSVIDRVWHELEKEAFGASKKPSGRDAARRERVPAAVGAPEELTDMDELEVEQE
ncbi:MAG TPA: hypothetical protein VF263_05790 [Longimicrobiaceae bacterium]